MLGCKTAEHKRQARDNGDPVEAGLVVERGQDRSENRGARRQASSYRHIDPKKGRSLLLGDLMTLDSGRSQTRIPEEPQKPCQRNDHPLQPEVLRR